MCLRRHILLLLSLCGLWALPAVAQVAPLETGGQKTWVPWHRRTYSGGIFDKSFYKTVLTNHGPEFFPANDLTLELLNRLPDQGGQFTGDGTGKGCVVTSMDDYDPTGSTFDYAKHGGTLRYALQQADKGGCRYYNYSLSAATRLHRCHRYVNEPKVWGPYGMTDYPELTNGDPTCLEESEQTPRIVVVPTGEIALRRPLVIPPGVILLGGMNLTPQAKSGQPVPLTTLSKPAPLQGKTAPGFVCPSLDNPVGTDTDYDGVPDTADSDTVTGDHCMPDTVRAGTTTVTMASDITPADFQLDYFVAPLPAPIATTRALILLKPLPPGTSAEEMEFSHVAGFTFVDAPYEALEIRQSGGIYEWMKFTQDPAKKQYIKGTKRNLKDQSKWTCVDYDKTAKKCNLPNAPLYSCADPAVSALQCMQYFVCATADGQEYLCKDHPDYDGKPVELTDGAYGANTPAIRLVGDQNILQHLAFDIIGEPIAGDWEAGLELRFGESTGAVAAHNRRDYLWGNYVAHLTQEHNVTGHLYNTYLPVNADGKADPAGYLNGQSHLLNVLPAPQFEHFFVEPHMDGFEVEAAHHWTNQGWDTVQIWYTRACTFATSRVDVYARKPNGKVIELTAERETAEVYEKELQSALQTPRRVLGALKGCRSYEMVNVDVQSAHLTVADEIILVVHAIVPRVHYNQSSDPARDGWTEANSFSGQAGVPVTIVAEPVRLGDVDDDRDGFTQYCEVQQGLSDGQFDSGLRESHGATDNTTSYTKERLDPETCAWHAYEAGGTVTIPQKKDPPKERTPTDRHDNPDRTTPDQRRHDARDRVDDGPAPRIAPPKDNSKNRGGGGGTDKKGGTTNPPSGDPTNPPFGGGNGGGNSTGGDGGITDTSDASCINGFVIAGSTAECPQSADPTTDDAGDQGNSAKKDDELTPPPHSQSACGPNLIQFGTLCVASPCGQGLIWNVATQQCDNGADKNITPPAAASNGSGCSLLF